MRLNYKRIGGRQLDITGVFSGLSYLERAVSVGHDLRGI